MGKRISVKKIFYTFFVLGLIFVFLLSFLTFLIIYKDVRDNCQKARIEYGKDCGDSMMMILQSDEKTFREKNKAVWILGQLADKRALPVLKNLYTEETSQKESLDKSISQYELKKAIKWCEEGNITSWMYKNL